MTYRSASLLLVLATALSSTAGCDSGPPAPPERGPLGRPDPTHGTITAADIDGDGVPNDSDVCPSLANADQTSRCEYMPPPSDTTDGLTRLNFWREQLGLDPVEEDPELTRTCQLHVDYLQQVAIDQGQPAYLSHQEDPAHPLYTEEGAQAGMDSVLSYGTATGAAAVDGWLDTLYHRIPLLHPGLTTVGVVFDERYACIHFRPGTDESVPTPHPILWPVADSPYTRPIFGGNESPCPTLEDPLAGGECPGSAAIATLGLYGSTFDDVEATMTRVDTGEDVPLFHIWHDGGPSPHEMMGYLDGTIALVPDPFVMYAAATYEVSVNATIDGAAENIRWRFSIGGIDQGIDCDLFGDQSEFGRAVAVTAASINGRVCGATGDFYRIRDAGTYQITLQYDRRVGALELVAYDAGMVELARSADGDGTGAIADLPGMTYLEVRGAGGAMGGYILVIE